MLGLSPGLSRVCPDARSLRSVPAFRSSAILPKVENSWMTVVDTSRVAWTFHARKPAQQYAAYIRCAAFGTTGTPRVITKAQHHASKFACCNHDRDRRDLGCTRAFSRRQALMPAPNRLGLSRIFRQCRGSTSPGECVGHTVFAASTALQQILCQENVAMDV